MNKLLFPLALSLVITLIGIAVYSTIVKPNLALVYSSDFTGLITGAKIIKEHQGKNLYDLPTQLRYQQQIFQPLEKSWLLPYRWPPFVSLLFLPLVNLPLIDSYRLWTVVNLSLFLLFLLFSKLSNWFKVNNLGLILALLSPAVFFTIVSGQTSLLQLLVFFSVYVSLRSKKSCLAGLLCGLISLKPQYLIALPFFFFLSKKKGSFLAGLFFSLMLINSFNVYLSGTNYLFNYLDFLSKTEGLQFGNRPHQMFSLHSTLLSVPFLPKLPWDKNFLINGILYLLSLTFFVSKKGLSSFNRLFSSALIFTLVFSVHTLSHDLTFLLLPLLLLLKEGYRVAPLILFIIPSMVFLGNTYPASLILLATGIHVLRRD